MQKMDPQLRKLLEVSYEALIHSGLIIGDMPSERCGVYIGCCGSEVRLLMLNDKRGKSEIRLPFLTSAETWESEGLYWQHTSASRGNANDDEHGK